jgi:hypothetical protein
MPPVTGSGTSSSWRKTAKTTPIASLAVPFHDSDSYDDENGWTPVRIRLIGRLVVVFMPLWYFLCFGAYSIQIWFS